MISYRIAIGDLESLVEKEVPGWITRAEARTRTFITLGKYDETSSIWSEIKAVYIRLQGDGKCAYCERTLEGEERGKAEYDIEHYRPKSSVKAWKLPDALSKQGVVVTTPAKGSPGYHKLPYHLFNYCVACKPCNSALKSDRFPIAGAYVFHGGNPVALAAEKPLLIYPVGDFESDAEQLIGFHGVSPHAVAPTGHDRHRALVTIAFFELDNLDKRKNLIRDRARIIIALHPQLEILAGQSSAATKKVARKIIDGYTSERAPHANCARSFVALHGRSPGQAASLFVAAADFIETTS